VAKKNSPKVLILLGSPRKKGNTAILAARAAAAAKAAGARVESVYLHGLNIRPCSACGACQKKNAKGCVIRDDMQSLYPKLREADALLFATPVYWFHMSAQTKLAMDRCYALVEPQGHAFAGKRIGIIMAYGAPDVFSSGGVNALRTFQDAFGFIGAKIVGMVYGCASWRQAARLSPMVQAGRLHPQQALLKAAEDLGKKLAG
jgi:multimeric flavodoxin WrbA